MQSGENTNQSFSNSQIKNIATTVNENLLFIKSQLGDGIGLSEGRFKAFRGYIEIAVVFIQSLCNKELINTHIIPTLLHGELDDTTLITDIPTLTQTLYISSLNTKKVEQKEDVIVELLKGNTVIFFDNCSSALIVESRKIDKRPIDKPENEITIFAAKEAFVEDIDTNIGLIIKRLPIPLLKVHSFTAGRLSQTNSKLLWIDGVAKDNIINEVKSRLINITTDMIDNTSTLAKLIQDKPTSIFPTYRLTERPDLASKALSDGFFVILCNNSPFALIGPVNFWDSFKTMDDYAELTFASSLLRIIRLMAFLISIIISPLYLAFVTYNHTIVPPSLALNISQGRDGVPFPSIIELIGMTIIIDIIREAGTRMPGIVGYFIGTLGAVIIGQAAVAAGYVSVSLIIVVAFSAIASFAISSTTLVNTSRIINYFLILLSGLLGIFGFFNGSFLILWRMSILESFGVPYLYPVIPVEFQGWKDLFIRAPFKMLKNKLTLIANVSGNKSEDRKKQ